VRGAFTRRIPGVAGVTATAAGTARKKSSLGVAASAAAATTAGTSAPAAARATTTGDCVSIHGGRRGYCRDVTSGPHGSFVAGTIPCQTARYGLRTA